MKNSYSFVKKLIVILLLSPLVISLTGQTKSATQSNTFNFYDTHYAVLNSLFQSIVSEAPLTLFLPTKDAFENLTQEQKDFYFIHPYTDLIDLLKGHMVSGVYKSNNLTDYSKLEAINGNILSISDIDQSIYINDSKVKRADIHFGRSIIHFIDQVIVQEDENTVVDIIVNSEDHNTLEAAVIAAELADDLAGKGPFTVFAPTDDAFAALPEGTVEALLEDPTGDLAQILLYHVVSGKALSTDLSDGQIIETLQGKKVEVKIMDGKVYINDAMVTVADVMADNGVVHVIDAILIPPTTTVVDIIMNSEDHNTLEAAVIAAELADDLAGEGPFTVFAPTDDAFAELPEGTVEALLEDPTGDLAQILLYHVVSGKALSTDLSDGQMIETLQGKKVEVKIMDGKVYINDAMVTVADVMADNGVVHVIDAVLIPPTTTVVDIIVNSEDHNTLEAAVIAAELADDLAGEGPFTVFAPTDDAFAALPEGTVEALLEDPTGDLAQILLYHVVSGIALSTDLSDGQLIETLQGKKVEVKIMDGKVYINDAMVTVADVMADNGVVHVIDAVLIPPTNTSVEDSASQRNIKVYPNPASDFIHILRESNSDYSSVNIYNASGRLVVVKDNYTNQEPIDIGALKKGIYIVKFFDGSSEKFSKLIVK